MVEIQAPVAGQNVVCFFESKAMGSGVHPIGFALQFEESANRRLVDRGDSAALRCRVLGTVLLVPKYWYISERLEDRGQGGGVINGCLDFGAALMPSGLGLAFESQDRRGAGLAQPKQMAGRPQGAAGRVEDRVSLESTVVDEAKTTAFQ